jgi:hypothetical protein
MIRNWISRGLVAVWFIGMVAVSIWNGDGVVAQRSGPQSVHLPLLYHAYDPTLRDYIGLVSVEIDDTTADLYTIRADDSNWKLLVDNVYPSPYSWSWSPDGKALVYIDGLGSEDTSLVLIPLNTGEPQTIYEGDVTDSFYWSPDSRYLSFSTETEGRSIHIYDTVEDRMYGIPVQSTYPVAIHHAIWSSDSQTMAWWYYVNSQGVLQVGVWNNVDLETHFIYTGDGERTLYWSPDGNRLMFTANSLTEGYGIYGSDKKGTPATMLIPDYSMQGWVNGGTHLLIRQANAYFLAEPDGANPTFFRSWSSRNPVVSVSPGGEYVIFTDHGEVPQDSILQATDSLIPAAQFRCRGIYLRWQTGGNRFACDSNDSITDGYQITIGDTTLNPPFLNDTTSYLVTQKTTTGYPANPIGTEFYNLLTGVFKQIQLPDYERIRIWEWRYMP